MTGTNHIPENDECVDFAIDHLQQMPVFGGINENTLQFVLNKSRMLSFAKGEYIIREGDKASSMFVLMQGEIVILRNWKGDKHALCELGQGDCFGEMSIMDLMPRSASIQTITDCKAIEIPSSCFGELYDFDREQFAILQMNMGREVSRRLRETEEKLFQYMMECIEKKYPAN